MTDSRFTHEVTREMLGEIVYEDKRAITFRGVTNGVHKKLLQDLYKSRTTFMFEGKKAEMVFTEYAGYKAANAEKAVYAIEGMLMFYEY